MNAFARVARMDVAYLARPASTPIATSIRAKSTLTQVFSEKAIHPIGPFYSQAITANGFVFLSAQLPADSQCKLITGTTAEQAHKMIQNAGHVLEAAGSNLEHVVKVNLFLKDFSKIAEVNEVYAKYFPQRPARTTSQVAAMPAGAEMMMDMVAVVGGSVIR